MSTITWDRSTDVDAGVLTAVPPLRRVVSNPPLTLPEERRRGSLAHVSGGADEVAWESGFIAGLRRLILSGARSHQVLEPEALAAAVRLLNDVMETDSPAPDLVVTVHGGLQLEWHLTGVDLEVETFPDGDIVAVFASGDDEWDAEGHAVTELVKTAVAHVSTLMAIR